jgi:hypothetical protein
MPTDSAPFLRSEGDPHAHVAVSSKAQGTDGK